MPTTPEDVAKWMRDEFLKTGELYQASAVTEVEPRFGSAFVFANDRGNPAITRQVLAAFKLATADEDVIWDKWSKCWRRRYAGDPTGRRSF